jgi:hypothetical protein
MRLGSTSVDSIEPWNLISQSLFTAVSQTVSLRGHVARHPTSIPFSHQIESFRVLQWVRVVLCR